MLKDQVGRFRDSTFQLDLGASVLFFKLHSVTFIYIFFNREAVMAVKDIKSPNYELSASKTDGKIFNFDV